MYNPYSEALDSDLLEQGYKLELGGNSYINVSYKSSRGFNKNFIDNLDEKGVSDFVKDAEIANGCEKAAYIISWSGITFDGKKEAKPTLDNKIKLMTDDSLCDLSKRIIDASHTKSNYQKKIEAIEKN